LDGSFLLALPGI